MLTHTTDFRVNIYDLDAWGELRSNVLLRWLQQAASDASAAAGFDVAWYARAGTLWVIRRTIVEYLAPVHYEDVLEVRTWVADLRRVRSQREYEVWRTADRTLVARGSTDWVYVDLARGVPARPPEEMVQRLMPGASAQPRPPRAAADPPPCGVRTTRRVELADLDSVAHVNNAHYAVYVEQAVCDALAAHGCRVDPSQRAAHLRVQRHDLEYFAEAQYEDRLEAAVWTTAVDGAGFQSQCTLTRGATRLLHASSRWAWSEGVLPAPLRAAVDALAVSA
jgi:acyl-CoA thioester hydrolase